MLFTETQNRLLAVLFASGSPLEEERFEEAMELSPKEVRQHLTDLAALMDELELPIELRRLDGSWQLCSRAVYGDLIRRTLEMGRSAPLSAAAMETLAIIAYNQPVTRAFVEQIRGVDSSGVVSSLLDKGLLEEAGRLDLPGRPIAYRTTAAFLRCFNLESLEQLPPVGENDPAADDPAEDEDGQLNFAMLSRENDGSGGAQTESSEDLQ